MIINQQALVTFKKIRDIGGNGQNSNVFLSHDVNLNANIALKEVSKKSDDYKTFFEEARNLYLSSHPNIVQINYACEDNDNVYIALPYYKNGSIKEKISNNFLTVREIIRYSIHILTGLHNIHSKGLIHFDIKPDNILISDRDEAMISDFGLAKVIDPILNTAIPPKFYNKQLPPEYFSYDPKTFKGFTYKYDIYQVGLTMYRMCVGNEKFDLQLKAFKTNIDFAQAVLKGNFPDRKAYPIHIPKKLSDAINKCLKVDLATRADSALEVINKIADIDEKLLDWKYENDGTYDIWKKDNPEKVLKVCSKGISEAYSLSESSQKRKIMAYCKKNIQSEDIISFLTKY